MDLVLERGAFSPFGPTLLADGVNFALPAPNASGVTLQLFQPNSSAPFSQIILEPSDHRTGGVWHVKVLGLKAPFEYTFLLDGREILDPYSRGLSRAGVWMQQEGAPRSAVSPPNAFDWEGIKKPALPLDQLVIYEMHVRGFTADPSAGVDHPGTYLGVIEKIPYLKKLGINAVELMPVYAFNESEFRPATENGISYCNFWGYSPIHFFAPMGAYATQHQAAIEEFKAMVKALHKEHIEVILDVVYNHTGEGNQFGPTYSWKALANQSYYLMNHQGEYYNYSGCGNTFACNHPYGLNMIIESMRYWAQEMQVDGFRFDLASILSRGPQGEVLKWPPVIEQMVNDPLLQGVKLIAEPWDAAGLYQLGGFPGWGFGAEWNGRYRDNVRRFIRGVDGMASAFATGLCGSTDLYWATGRPTASINFITAHDGFSLHDLVSYNDKHNEDNNEGGRDGANDNESWNCGVEGETDNSEIRSLRQKQMKNFFCALLLSQGVPMILMGDEYGHTKNGNNNTWCIDDARNYMRWDELETNQELLRFVTLLIDLRKKHPILRSRRFLGPHEIRWHGATPGKADWSPSCRLVICSLHDSNNHDELMIIFNMSDEAISIDLPTPDWSPHWQRILDTSRPFPEDFLAMGERYTLFEGKQIVAARSCIVLHGYHP